MKQKHCITAILLLTASLSSACATKQTLKPEQNVLSSNVSKEDNSYSEEDITSAITSTKQYFKEHFIGCTLTQISYEGDTSYQSEDEWAKQYEEEEAIVLVSSFDVAPKGADGSLNPNSTYENWQWILTRSGTDSWTVQTYGY